MTHSTSLRRSKQTLGYALLLGFLSWASHAETVWVRAGKLVDVERGRILNNQAILIAVEGDPLLDIDKLRQVRGVIKAGRQIRLD